MGVSECACWQSFANMGSAGLSQQEPPWSSVLGARLKVNISWILIPFPKSFIEHENLDQNVILKNRSRPKRINSCIPVDKNTAAMQTKHDGMRSMGWISIVIEFFCSLYVNFTHMLASWRRSHGGGISRRSCGEGVMQKESWGHVLLCSSNLSDLPSAAVPQLSIWDVLLPLRAATLVPNEKQRLLAMQSSLTCRLWSRPRSWFWQCKAVMASRLWNRLWNRVHAHIAWFSIPPEANASPVRLGTNYVYRLKSRALA